jgi:hypothetical protein
VAKRIGGSCLTLADCLRRAESISRLLKDATFRGRLDHGSSFGIEMPSSRSLSACRIGRPFFQLQSVIPMTPCAVGPGQARNSAPSELTLTGARIRPASTARLLRYGARAFGVAQGDTVRAYQLFNLEMLLIAWIKENGCSSLAGAKIS